IDEIITSIKMSTGYRSSMIDPKAEILPPVELWLKGFRDAELVITDSFHGTVFSIINNTPFIVLENEVGGISRLTHLLNELGIKDRLVYADDDGDFDIH